MPHGRLLITTLLCCAIGLAQGEDKQPEPAPESATTETPAAAIERAPMVEHSELQAQALARQLPRQAKTLQAGEERFLGFWQLAHAAQPKGTIVLIPGTGETPDWPRVVGPLWRALPEYGWNTLSISLPDPQTFIPARTPETTEANSTQDNAEANKAPESPAETEPADNANAQASEESDNALKAAERITARITAALDFAQAQESSIVILMGHGTGGYWASLYLSQEGSAAVQQLSLIQPKQPAGENVPLEDLIPKLKTTAISDFYDQSIAADKAQAQLRLENSIRSQHPAYYQLPLKIAPGDLSYEQGQLVRRVRGWLDRQVQSRM